MGNCQAVDNASFVLQTQTGRTERFYSPVSAAEIMKLHPGHCVALLLTTTFYSYPPSSTSGHINRQHKQQPGQEKHPNNNNNNNNNNSNTTNTNQQPLRVTRIKLLRPTDNLMLGNAYRLITNQEVMKGLKGKKNGKFKDIKDFQALESTRISEANSKSGATSTISNRSMETHHQMRKSDKHRSRTSVPTDPTSVGNKSGGWHPSLNSISETTS